MVLPQLHGVVPIHVTPFDETGQIDEDNLANQVEFNVSAGVHGLGVALGREIFKFNEAERAQITASVVRAARRRVPIIINTGAAGTDLAIAYSKATEATGADALMIIPPAFMPANADEILDYYVAIDRAVGLPVILQDVQQTPISSGLALKIADVCRNIRYIKVETLPVVSKVSAKAELAGDKLTIFGRAGGGYFIEELRRGSLGTMPLCSQPADFVAVWEAFRSGDEKLARQRFDRSIMAINRLGAQAGEIFHSLPKLLLVRQGVIRTAMVRSPTTAIDPVTAREIAELLAQPVPFASPFHSFAAPI